MAWFGALQGWTRRKSKFVNGTSAGTQPRYQIKIAVYIGGIAQPVDTSIAIFCGGNCRSDFGDIRFTDSDGSTLLNYWIESTGMDPNFGSYANVWINVPNLPTSGKNIYIYYNNPSQTTTSNGVGTFVFFDGFDNSSDLSNYSIIYYNYSGGSCGATIANFSAITTSTYVSPPSSMALEIGCGCYETTYWILATRSLSIPSGTYEVDFWTKTVYGNYGGGAYPNYSYTQINGVNQSSSLATSWTYYSFVYTGSISSIGLYSTWYGFNGDPGAYWDDIRIRNYASPEPTFGSSGIEELNITATAIALDKYSCSSTCSVNAFVTWYNYGSVNIVNFTPSILIDGGTPQAVQAYGEQITIPSLGSASSGAISTPILSVGTHTICPYPN